MTTAWYADAITNGYLTGQVAGNWDSPHYAVDLATPFHTPITSLFDGTVVKSDYAQWGGEIYIQLANGLQEYFYHLDDIASGIVPGTKIKAGQFLGLSGGQTSGGDHPTNAQYSTGLHTHVGFFTKFLNGKPYGPDITSALLAARVNGIGSGGTSDLLNSPLTTLSQTSANPITDISSGLAASLASVSAFFTELSKPDLWIRIALVIGGLVLAIAGLVLFVRDAQ